MVTESLISTEVPDEQLPIRVEAAPAHLREDAERNRKRLIEAAASAFAEFGFGVPIEEIARRAGVGKATVFRRFPTKERLVEAIMVERMTMLAEAGAPLLDADDAGAALRQFMRTGVELISQDRGLCDAVQGLTSKGGDIRTVKLKMLGTLGALLSRAQTEGSIRGDVVAADIMLLVLAVGRLAAPFHESAPQLWQRYLDLVFDGLRPAAAHPCSQPPPTEDQLVGVSPISPNGPSLAEPIVCAGDPVVTLDTKLLA